VKTILRQTKKESFSLDHKVAQTNSSENLLRRGLEESEVYAVCEAKIQILENQVNFLQQRVIHLENLNTLSEV
jgi:hypothetical protein